MEKLIIDTDPGIDDTMAIYYALESPGLEVVGLTTVFGNVDVEMATENALRLLEIADCPHIPVAVGAAHSLLYPYHGAVPHIHGEDGQGNVFLDPPTLDPIDQTAADFIVEQVMMHPGEITLVPIGPLTNIALALRLEPRIVENVKRLVLMGGAALVPGNVNPAAEANIYGDPEAAKMVFEAAWDVTMVGLDVTHEVVMKPNELARYAASKRPTSKHIARILPVYTGFARRSMGNRGLYMHDPTAVSYLLHPELFEVKSYPLAVETQGISRGKTWVWTWDYRVPPPDSDFDASNPVDVVLGADVEVVIAALLETV